MECHLKAKLWTHTPKLERESLCPLAGERGEARKEEREVENVQKGGERERAAFLLMREGGPCFELLVVEVA